MPVSIRTRLLLLVLSLLLLGLAGAAWIIVNTLEAERGAHEQSLRSSSRAMAMVVEGDLAHRAALRGTVQNEMWPWRPGELQRLVDAQGLPADWVGTVVGDRGIVVASHPGGQVDSGREVTVPLRAQMAAAREGLFDSVSQDGRNVTGYYGTSSRGWTYVVAMPREQYVGLSRRALVQLGVGALILLALAVVGAIAVSAAIAHSCAALEQRVADASARMRQAEHRLSQGQHDEALGRLTGGVSHDFNNLLGILSNSAHLIGRHPAAAELEAPLAAMHRAVQTGRQLTEDLLRFADRRAMASGAVELSHCLPEVMDLVRSSLGRRIELVVQVAPGTAPVLVDSGGLDLALINLALNARDAMPDGGAVRVAARNATDEDREDFSKVGGGSGGRWVLVTVSDDGVGMTPEVAAQAFEPFFSTSAVGAGSGLGLGQVHGFCTQAGGAVRVASTPGLGTTVLMLLPAAVGTTALPETAHASAAASNG